MNRYPWLHEYLLQRPGATTDYKPEWEWQRYQVGGHMFAATCWPGPEHTTAENRELISLKCEPLRSDALRGAFSDIIPGFYCDKRTWISVYLDGTVPDDLLRELCDQSYALVFSKLTKKRQREIKQDQG